MKLEISIADLAVNDVIIDGKSGVTVKKLAPCPLTTLRGLPKIHVNGSYCYDTIGRVTVERKRS